MVLYRHTTGKRRTLVFFISFGADGRRNSTTTTVATEDWWQHEGGTEGVAHETDPRACGWGWDTAWRGVLPVKDLFRDEFSQDHAASHRRRGTEHRRAPVAVAPAVVTTTHIARMWRVTAALDITRTTRLLIVVNDRSGLRRERRGGF